MTILKLIAFPGAPNLPFFVGAEKRHFSAYGIEVELTTTPSSTYQAEKLAAGVFDIAGTAFDNVVAYVERQGAIALDPTPDFFAFMGASRVELSLVAASVIGGIPDLAGRPLALDALATGFAFAVYKMLEDGGLALDAVEMQPVGATPERLQALREGSAVAALLIEPFTSMAEAEGYRVLAGSSEAFVNYQGGVFAARRDWAAENRDALIGFMAGYLDALDWVLAPDNRDEATAILLTNMPAIKPEAAGRVMDKLLSPVTGLTPAGMLDMDGVRTVLDLRRRYGPGGAALDDPSRYIDLSYYNEALARRL